MSHEYHDSSMIIVFKKLAAQKMQCLKLLKEHGVPALGVYMDVEPLILSLHESRSPQSLAELMDLVDPTGQ